ncbi:DUF3077 domain-containing protein [Pseudomonas caspiana]|uniref:DUF3077 domain-containing protein n=1 Tax=Pseudomonas caspiana TaxID=1451454 RepID=A0A1Y3P5Q9_9PSED|nr:DUF3077 domain-containing protein [Pseudomonas caspiana]OUM75147.1 hypothetical protein AUC60_02795 [Pseudomonas caspiana]
MTTDHDLKTVGKTLFGRYDAENIPLFSVSAGVSIEEALEHASCLMGCVRELTLVDSMGDEADVRVWSAHYLGEMAKAIIDDVTIGLKHSRTRP